MLSNIENEQTYLCDFAQSILQKSETGRTWRVEYVQSSSGLHGSHLVDPSGARLASLSPARGVSESLGRLSRPADQLTGFKPLSKSKERQGWQGDSQADCDALGEASYVPSQRLPRSCTAPSELCFLHNLKLAHCFCKTPNSTALHPTSTGRSKIHFQVQLGKHPYYPYWWVFRVY